MRAMILAAGRGERLRPLTDKIPKPLIKVNGKCLIAYQLEALQKAGITEAVVSVSYFSEEIITTLGDGSRYGIELQYSIEPQALGVGGGIFKALPLLGNDPFMVINCDLWTDYSLINLVHPISGLAHLVLVPNPKHNQNGDFGLQAGKVMQNAAKKYTFAGMGVYHPELFTGCKAGGFSIVPLLKQAMQHEKVSGELYCGKWVDVGTPERLSGVSH